MFSIEQIKTAHSKVKSGADFPAFIQNLKGIGVNHYETFVADGHTNYYGADNYKITSPAKYETLSVAENADGEQFIADLKVHQNGQTDYPAFCNDAARSGIEKWSVCMDEMTCIYFDKAGNKILTEQIPAIS